MFTETLPILTNRRTHWDPLEYYPCKVAPPRFHLFVFFASHSSARILFRLRHFARPASRKTELRKNYLFALSALRNTKVLGDLRVNFTTKLTVVNFTSADWLSYLRTQLKAFVDRVLGGVCLRNKRPFFLISAVFSNDFFSPEAYTLKNYNSKEICSIALTFGQ